MKALVWIFLAGWGMLTTGFGQEPEALRRDFGQLIERGLWRDAVTFYKEKLSPLSDAGSGSDLSKAANALGRLNEWGGFDELVETSVASHPENPWLLQAAADVYRNAPASGRIIGGAFERGWSGKGGIVVGTDYRDRVRRLQLLLGSLEHAGDDEPVRREGWSRLADTLGADEAWKLQLLTPLHNLPDWQEIAQNRNNEGAPWKGDDPGLQ